MYGGIIHNNNRFFLDIFTKIIQTSHHNRGIEGLFKEIWIQLILSIHQTHIRRYLSSDSLLPSVHKCFVISQFKDGFKSKLRSSRSCITLRMSPLGVAPQVSDHGCEGTTIPRPSAIAQGSKSLRQDIGWHHRSLAGRNHHRKQMLSRMGSEPLQS